MNLVVNALRVKVNPIKTLLKNRHYKGFMRQRLGPRRTGISLFLKSLVTL